MSAEWKLSRPRGLQEKHGSRRESRALKWLCHSDGGTKEAEFGGEACTEDKHGSHHLCR